PRRARHPVRAFPCPLQRPRSARLVPPVHRPAARPWARNRSHLSASRALIALMNRTLAFVSCAVLCHVGVAAPEPTPDELAERAKTLEHKLAGQGYTVLVEPPFVVVGDSPAAEVKRIATGFLRSKAQLLEKDFFAKRPDKLIEVWLFKNEKSFRKGAKKFFG